MKVSALISLTLQHVVTRWGSTFEMFDRIYILFDPVMKTLRDINRTELCLSLIERMSFKKLIQGLPHSLVWNQQTIIEESSSETNLLAQTLEDCHHLLLVTVINQWLETIMDVPISTVHRLNLITIRVAAMCITKPQKRNSNCFQHLAATVAVSNQQVVEYWTSSGRLAYPTLSRIARKIFTIPSTSVVRE